MQHMGHYYSSGHRGSGEVSNGRISLEAARLEKLHEVSLADAQKAVQDAVQVSKSFLASSCLPQGPILCRPALHRCVGYPRASQMVLDTFV